MIIREKTRTYRFIIAVLMTAFTSSANGASEELVKAANKEGSLLIYGVGPDMREPIAKFNERFPSIKVAYLAKQRIAIFETISREIRAGVYKADVYGNLSGVNGLLLAKHGLLSRYSSPERSAIPANLKDREGYWTAMSGTAQVYAYNSALVAPKDVPRSYDDFLSPKWKGKIGMHQEESEWYATMLEIMGQEKGLAFMKRLAQQEPTFQGGRNIQMQLLCAGEFSLIIPMNYYRVVLAMKKGCPVNWVAIEPVTQRSPFLIGMANNAPHPAAAKLFIDWILSKEAQNFMQESMLHQSVREDVEPAGDLLKLKGLRVWKSNWDSIFRNYDAHAKAYREIFNIR